MTAIYSIARRDPVSRIRLAIGDTNTENPRFTDEELEAILDDTSRRHYLWLYFDSGADATVTAATLQVRLAPATVELVLSRTIGGVATPQAFPLAGSLQYDTIGELVDAIQALEQGWAVGLDDGAFQRWLSGEWSEGYSSIPLAQFTQVLAASSLDLAVTGAALDVYGSAKKKRLTVYDVEAAIARADTLRRTGEGDYKEMRDGNVTRVRFDQAATGKGGGGGAHVAYASWRKW